MNSEVKSAGRILDILEYMSDCREPIPLARIIRDLSLPKSSAHGLVQTLVARGHVSRNSMGHYVLVESSRHGFPFRRHEEPLVVTAMPFMERLRDEFTALPGLRLSGPQAGRLGDAADPS